MVEQVADVVRLDKESDVDGGSDDGVIEGATMATSDCAGRVSLLGAATGDVTLLDAGGDPGGSGVAAGGGAGNTVAWAGAVDTDTGVLVVGKGDVDGLAREDVVCVVAIVVVATVRGGVSKANEVAIDIA